MENIPYQELFSRALANGQIVFGKYRPEAASLLTLTSSSNPFLSWSIFTGSSINSPLYSGTRRVVKWSHGTISVSLRTFSTKMLEEVQGKSTSAFQEGMQPFFSWATTSTPTFKQSHSDVDPQNANLEQHHYMN